MHVRRRYAAVRCIRTPDVNIDSERRNFIRKPALTALFFCLLFILLGALWIRYPGIQNDEALFAAPLYHPTWANYWVETRHVRIPIMLMSYLGALKSWIYAGIFHFFAPGPASVRLPMLLAGALSVWLFFCLLARLAGDRAALIGTALLATDATYLLTIRCDWGPVALQHLLLVSGLLLVVKYYQQGSILRLAAGFFLFGAGCWDKALFVWMLGGVAAGAVLVFPRELWRSLRPLNAAVAALAFSAGASPLLIYNLAGPEPLGTLRGNLAWEISQLPAKAPFVTQSLSGSTLFGYWSREDGDALPRDPETRLERVCLWLSGVSGKPRRNLLNPALLAALAAAALLWRTPVRRIVLFTLIAGAVAWLPMGAIRNAGGGVHHTVLLWPLPQLLIGAVFAEAARRFGRAAPAMVTAAVVLVCGSNLLLLNNYYARLIRNGGSVTWTDAIYPLSDYLKTVPARQVFSLDWGLIDPLRLLNRGHLELGVGSEPFAKDAMSEEDRKEARRMAAPGNLFLGHTEGNEFDPRVPRQLAAWAREEGCRKQVLQVIRDRNGRAIFEVFRLEWISGPPTSRTPAPGPASRPGA